MRPRGLHLCYSLISFPLERRRQQLLMGVLSLEGANLAAGLVAAGVAARLAALLRRVIFFHAAQALRVRWKKQGAMGYRAWATLTSTSTSSRPKS